VVCIARVILFRFLIVNLRPSKYLDCMSAAQVINLITLVNRGAKSFDMIVAGC